jgi:hypothetical protein
VAAGQRLADQLQVLSQVVETITYRLLDLEEQALGLQRRLQGLSEAAEDGPPQPAVSAEARQRLDDTEERLLRIESMLSRAAGTAVGGHLSVVETSGPAASVKAIGDPAPSGALDIDGPFPEEPEQPFLDDLPVGAEQGPDDDDGEPGFLTA